MTLTRMLIDTHLHLSRLRENRLTCASSQATSPIIHKCSAKSITSPEARGVRGFLYQVPPPTPQVYHWCTARTNIDIDETACRVVMDRYQLTTKRDAVIWR
jgi:hypothetical protein